MLKLTKIFHFEMAHAIHGHAGACKYIHGHSYELQVTISAAKPEEGYIPAPGFLIDFKEIKELVSTLIIHRFDHRLVLSNKFLLEYPALSALENLVVFEEEPTAENLLYYFRTILKKTFPGNIRVIRLCLYETKDSYAEWEADDTSNH